MNLSSIGNIFTINFVKSLNKFKKLNDFIMINRDETMARLQPSYFRDFLNGDIGDWSETLNKVALLEFQTIHIDDINRRNSPFQVREDEEYEFIRSKEYFILDRITCKTFEDTLLEEIDYFIRLD